MDVFNFFTIDTSGASHLSDEALIVRIAATGWPDNAPGWGNVAEALKRLAKLTNTEENVLSSIEKIEARASNE